MRAPRRHCRLIEDRIERYRREYLALKSEFATTA
jgi:hypothetical protein